MPRIPRCYDIRFVKEPLPGDVLVHDPVEINAFKGILADAIAKAEQGAYSDDLTELRAQTYDPEQRPILVKRPVR